MAILFMGFRPRGVVATPGYFIASTPWAGTKTNTSWSTRDQASNRLGGGHLTSATTQNNEYTEDHYLPTGTVKVALIHTKDTDAGVYSIQFDGVEKASIDGYASPQAVNTYSEVTGIASTAGVVTVKNIMSTKNASSSAYAGRAQTFAIVRTAA